MRRRTATRCCGSTTANTSNVTFYDGLHFDFLRDIAPVAALVRVPLVMVVNPSVPAKTLPEFIAYAKGIPARSTWRRRVAELIQLAGELFKSMAGVEMTHIPYRGGGPHYQSAWWPVDVFFDAGVHGHATYQADKLRALAVTVQRVGITGCPDRGRFCLGL